MGFAPTHAPTRAHTRGSLATNTRAIALTDVLKPGAPKRIVESEQLPKDLRDPVMDAIGSLGGKCTVGDVAAAAGVKVFDAENAMKAIAADTGATLEVSAQGDILYVFDRDFRGALNAKSAKIKTVEPLVENVGKVGGYLLRISFGTTLLASIVIVYTAIAALLSNRDDRDRDRRGGGGMGGGMFFGPRMYFSPFDMFWYWDPYYYEKRSYYAAMEGAKDMDFLEAVFSFVFGDGDPNADFERKRWALVGLCIQKNDGVVTAEQLAPFLDRDELSIGTDDESFVLPALTRFNGAPEVDPASGEIVYRFEDLESTAGASPRSRRCSMRSRASSASPRPSPRRNRIGSRSPPAASGRWRSRSASSTLSASSRSGSSRPIRRSPCRRRSSSPRWVPCSRGYRRTRWRSSPSPRCDGSCASDGTARSREGTRRGWRRRSKSLGRVRS